jgi:hypothetical protein
MVAASCGTADEGAEPREATEAASSEETEEPLTPEESRAAEQRAERRAEREERCRRLLAQVQVSFEISSVPTEAGPEVRLRVVVDNAGPLPLDGETYGRLQLPPGPGFRAIDWGGSSADYLSVAPRTTFRDDIHHSSVPPGTRPVSDMVLWFDAETTLGHGRDFCEAPARVTAPPDLVDGHPGGEWVIPADKSWRIGPDDE